MRLLSLAACAGLTLIISTGAFAQTVEQDGPQDEYSMDTEKAQDLFVKYHTWPWMPIPPAGRSSSRRTTW